MREEGGQASIQQWQKTILVHYYTRQRKYTIVLMLQDSLIYKKCMQYIVYTYVIGTAAITVIKLKLFKMKGRDKRWKSLKKDLTWAESTWGKDSTATEIKKSPQNVHQAFVLVAKIICY